MMGPDTSNNTTNRMKTIDPHSRVAYEVQSFVRQGIDLGSPQERGREHPVWKGLEAEGTQPWLDTGDWDAIEPLWNRHFHGLTTNNTLLNREVQRGLYDDLVAQADQLLNDLPTAQRVAEIALILNARHALRLVERFGCQVSVALHTDLAFDEEGTLAHARRLHEICPENFVVKVPWTPSGLIATRQLRQEGIRVNLTLGFSARQNYVATALANPSYVNVFLGRLGAYVANNHLGDGQFVGEKATLASQREVSVFARGLPQSETQQIAASIRDPLQVELLAGVDVITMPPDIAQRAGENPAQVWRSRLNEEYEVTLAADINKEALRLDKLWSIPAQLRKLVEQMILRPPSTAEELTATAGEYAFSDLFWSISEEDFAVLAADGKIPQHARWGDRILRDETAIDSLLTGAGLAAFSHSQSELDQRIRQQIGA